MTARYLFLTLFVFIPLISGCTAFEANISPFASLSADSIKINEPDKLAMTKGTLIIKGKCWKNSKMTVTGAGVATDITEPCSNGSFELTITLSDGDGEKLVTVMQELAGQEIIADNRIFIKDATAPLFAVLNPEDQTPAQDKLTVQGTCEDGLPIKVMSAVLADDEEQACANLQFSFDVVLGATDGPVAYSFAQEDLVGNKTTVAKTFVRDNVAPTVAFLTPPANTVAQALINITGSCETGLLVTLAGTGLAAPVTAMCAANQFMATGTLSDGDGNKVVTAKQTDLAGNTGEATRTFVKDSAGPKITILKPDANTVAKTGVKLEGACEAFPIVLSGTGLASPNSATCVNGAYAVDIVFSSGDGNKNIIASQTDGAGNTGASSRTFVKDATAPVVTITQPLAGALVKDKVNMSGTCESGLMVLLSGTGVATPVSTACTNAQYLAEVTLSAGEGAKVLTASQTDGADNTGTATRNVIKDTVAPDVKIVLPAAGTKADKGITLSGTCETGLKVKIDGTGILIEKNIDCLNAAFSEAILFSKGEGNKVINVAQTDLNDNTGTDTRTFERDFAMLSLAEGIILYNTNCASCHGGPLPDTRSLKDNTTALATITAINNNVGGMGSAALKALETNEIDAIILALKFTPALIAITDPAANTEAKTGVELKGTCVSAYPIALSGTGLQSPSTATCVNNLFTVNISFTAGDGPKNIIVSQTDTADKTSTATRTFIKDTTAPAITIAMPAANTEAKTSVMLTGTCESGLTVNLAGSGAAAPQTTSCVNSQFSSTVTFSNGDGAKVITAAQTDSAGNTGMTNRSFIKDTVAPVIAIQMPAALTVAMNTINLSGTCESGLQVVVAGTGAAAPVNTTCVASAFATAVTLSNGDGNKTITASQTDAAGNTGSNSRIFVKDNQGPAIAILMPAANTVAKNGVTLSGTCDAAYAIALSGTGLASPNSTTCSGGTFSVAITFSAGDGNKNIIASQTDGAGNTGSSSRSFIRDTTAPTITILMPAANTQSKTGVTLTGGCENGLTVNIAGTGVNAPSTTACASNQYSTAVTFSSGDGTKNITATQTDGVGNTKTVARNFIKDTTAPVILITLPAANTKGETGLTISGSCESGYPVTLAGTGVMSPVNTACSASAFSAAVLFTANDGTKTVTASQTDSAGNTGTNSRNYIREAAPLTLAEGIVLYNTNCMGCHGGPLPDTRSLKDNTTALATITAINNNVGGMGSPALKALKPNEIDAIILALKPPSSTPIDGLMLEALTPQSINLLSSIEFNTSISSMNDYAGDVDIEIDRTTLDLIEGAEDIELVLDTATVTLTKGLTFPLKITMTTKSSAPSFDASSFKLKATAKDGKAKPIELDYNFQVVAFIEINMLGRDADPAKRWREASDLSFRVHTDGLTVRVNNLDTREPHVLHGNSPIPHGSIANPLPASPDGVLPGGFDEFSIPATELRVGTYYHHDFESNINRRSLRFNLSDANITKVSGLRELASISEAPSVELKAAEGNPAHCTNSKSPD